MPDLAALLIDETRRRLAGFVTEVRTCVELYDEDELWTRANEKSNSVGNLVIHLCGSTRHFLCRGVGGTDYVRNRPAEFAERGPIPRADLLKMLDAIAFEIAQVLDNVDPARLLEVNERTGKPFSQVQLLLRVSHHWSTHAGQLVFDLKARKPDAVSELWMKALPNL